MKSFDEELLEVTNRGLMPDYSDHVRIAFKFWYERGYNAATADLAEAMLKKKAVKVVEKPVVKKAESLKKKR